MKHFLRTLVFLKNIWPSVHMSCTPGDSSKTLSKKSNFRVPFHIAHFPFDLFLLTNNLPDCNSTTSPFLQPLCWHSVTYFVFSPRDHHVRWGEYRPSPGVHRDRGGLSQEVLWSFFQWLLVWDWIWVTRHMQAHVLLSLIYSLPLTFNLLSIFRITSPLWVGTSHWYFCYLRLSRLTIGNCCEDCSTSFCFSRNKHNLFVLLFVLSQEYQQLTLHSFSCVLGITLFMWHELPLLTQWTVR